MKKKLLAVLLASTMVFSLAGCGSTGEAKTEEPAVAEETTEQQKRLHPKKLQRKQQARNG